MKTNEKKHEFIRLRARGLSYDAICKELGIAKGTAVKWSHEFEAEISGLKRDSLNDLYEQYGMVKESRVRALGETLDKIDEAIAAADFSKVPLSTLLRLKLDYQNALKAEYTPITEHTDINTVDDVKTALNGLYERTLRGDLSTEQLQRELTALRTIQHTLHDCDIKEKLYELEAIIEAY